MLSADAAAAQVQENLKAVTALLQKIDAQRKRSQPTLESIEEIHENLIHEGTLRIPPQYQPKLKNLYMQAATDSTSEEELLRQALNKIYEIRSIVADRRLQAKLSNHIPERGEAMHRGAVMKMLQVTATTLPLYVGRRGQRAPPLCGAIPPEPSHIAKPGDMVAALAKVADGLEENWILAEVISFSPVHKKYEVDDIDEDLKPRHTLSKRRVIPLPLMRANPETDPEALFPKGAVVMALYPQTTCFYKALVNQPPTSATDEYEVLFEDKEYTKGYSPPLKVAQRYVIEIKEKKKS